MTQIDLGADLQIRPSRHLPDNPDTICQIIARSPHSTDAQLSTSTKARTVVGGPPLHAGYDNVHGQSTDGQHTLPPTSNTSPLKDNIWLWHEELRAAHQHFCTDQFCTGVRPLPQLLQSDPRTEGYATRRACPLAVDADLLTYDIYHGFRILPPGVTLADVPPCSCSTEHKAHNTTQ